MRALAITGMLTAAMMPSIMSGSLIRETPPCARMSAGTRSRAITATAPASSAIFACSTVTTSMITPPLSISAIPRLTRAVPVPASVVGATVRCWAVLTATPVFVLGLYFTDTSHRRACAEAVLPAVASRDPAGCGLLHIRGRARRLDRLRKQRRESRGVHPLTRAIQPEQVSDGAPLGLCDGAHLQLGETVVLWFE